MDDYPDEVCRPTHAATGEYEVDTGGHRTANGSARADESWNWTAHATARTTTRLEDSTGGHSIPGHPDRVRGDRR
ncbi:hypothetical protein [Halomontanus rarus]|uniref:hypothetical protein n=1 Tax=Halomontanus rarus TaxID=3034020 RepID=UPI001A99150C